MMRSTQRNMTTYYQLLKITLKHSNAFNAFFLLKSEMKKRNAMCKRYQCNKKSEISVIWKVFSSLENLFQHSLEVQKKYFNSQYLLTYFYYKNIIGKLFTLQFLQEISVSHLKPSPQNVHLLLNEFAICYNSMNDYDFSNFKFPFQKQFQKL